MSLNVIGRLGRSGRIVVMDRRDDGTIIVLVCEEVDAVGWPYLPPEPAPQGPPPVMPWPEPRADEAARYAMPDSLRPPFQVILETTAMPAGPQQFRTDALLAKVFEAAADGIPQVTLTPHNARQWGWLEEVVA